jgi:Fe-S-cluster containining protein
MQASVPNSDGKLIQIVDTALADAARRSGEWLVCRPGCTQCCIGVFAMNQLDAIRLRAGLARLKSADPGKAAQVVERARESVARLAADFPGDPATGILSDGDEADEQFAAFANDEPCPALDISTGLCDLYESRPMTCRTFGPPVRSEGGLGVCELCYHGATDQEIAACEMQVPVEEEEKVLGEAESATGKTGRTIVAYALAAEGVGSLANS